MIGALAQALPFAIGLVLSPFPLVAMVMILSGPGRTLNGPAFAVASVAGLLAVGAGVLLLAAGYPADDAGQPATWLSIARLVLGVGLVGLAAKKLAAKPWRPAPAQPPRWIRSIDTLGPIGAAGLGILVSVLNPKNLVLALAGAGVIAQSDLGAGASALALVLFVAVGTLGITAPLALSLALGPRGVELLEGPKDWMERNSPIVVALVALIFGAVLVGNGTAGLA